MQLIFAVQFIFISSPQINNKGTLDVLLTLSNWTVISLLPSTLRRNHLRMKMSSPKEVTGVEEHRVISFTSWFPDKIYRADEKSKLLMKPKHNSHYLVSWWSCECAWHKLSLEGETILSSSYLYHRKGPYSFKFQIINSVYTSIYI